MLKLHRVPVTYLFTSVVSMEHTQTQQMQKASQMRFKDASFNLTEALISLGPDSPKGTYCYSATLQPSMGL